MRKLFEAHLARVEWGKLRSAVRLYPFVFGEATDVRPILIDPTISFGRPVVDHAFVSTRTRHRSPEDRAEHGRLPQRQSD